MFAKPIKLTSVKLFSLTKINLLTNRTISPNSYPEDFNLLFYFSIVKGSSLTFGVQFSLLKCAKNICR